MSFGALNYSILGLYLAGMVYVGIRFAGRQKTTEDYFLAGRKMPWLPVAMSMYASLTSAVTYMGLPGLAYKSNVTLIVVCIISPLLAPVLVMLFYPFYRKLGVTTSYEYIAKRFGQKAHVAASALFLLARLGWLGTVIYAPALALSVATGIELSLAILLMGLLATLYTVLGGLAAVLWTDVCQFVILVGGAIWVAVTLVGAVPGGFSGIMEVARAHDHIQLNWRISLFEMSAVAVGVSFFLQMMQDYGTDQVTVQRLLSVRDFKGVVKAVFFNACTDFVIIGTLLFIGLGLFAYYTVNPDIFAEAVSSDQMFPYFIINALPAGVSGLLIAAIFAAAMSSMDSGINSMSTVVVVDLVQPFRQKGTQAKHDVRLARLLTLLWGLLATAVARYVSTLEGIIEAFAHFMSLFSAPVLALFLMGMLTRFGRFWGWCIGAICAVGATYWLQTCTEVNWVYYFPFSLAVCLVIGLTISGLMGLVLPRRDVEDGLVVGGQKKRLVE